MTKSSTVGVFTESKVYVPDLDSIRLENGINIKRTAASSEDVDVSENQTSEDVEMETTYRKTLSGMIFGSKKPKKTKSSNAENNAEYKTMTKALPFIPGLKLSVSEVFQSLICSKQPLLQIPKPPNSFDNYPEPKKLQTGNLLIDLGNFLTSGKKMFIHGGVNAGKTHFLESFTKSEAGKGSEVFVICGENSANKFEDHCTVISHDFEKGNIDGESSAQNAWMSILLGIQFAEAAFVKNQGLGGHRREVILLMDDLRKFEEALMMKTVNNFGLVTNDLESSNSSSALQGDTSYYSLTQLLNSAYSLTKPGLTVAAALDENIDDVQKPTALFSALEAESDVALKFSDGKVELKDLLKYSKASVFDAYDKEFDLENDDSAEIFDNPEYFSNSDRQKPLMLAGERAEQEEMSDKNEQLEKLQFENNKLESSNKWLNIQLEDAKNTILMLEKDLSDEQMAGSARNSGNINNGPNNNGSSNGPNYTNYTNYTNSTSASSNGVNNNFFDGQFHGNDAGNFQINPNIIPNSNFNPHNNNFNSQQHPSPYKHRSGNNSANDDLTHSFITKSSSPVKRNASGNGLFVTKVSSSPKKNSLSPTKGSYTHSTSNMSTLPHPNLGPEIHKPQLKTLLRGGNGSRT